MLTGIAMSVAGDTRPSSGACHEINHAFDLLYPKRAASPRRAGAASAPPSRCTCAAPTRSRALMAEVLRRHGLPVLPEEIGFTADEFVKAVEYAPQTRPGPLHDPRAPRPVHRPDQGRIRRLCQSHQ